MRKVKNVKKISKKKPNLDQMVQELVIELFQTWSRGQDDLLQKHHAELNGVLDERRKAIAAHERHMIVVEKFLELQTEIFKKFEKKLK